MVHRLIGLLLLSLAVTACGRSLRSCAAYLAILGPSTVTIACPPVGFQGNETMPNDTTIMREKP